LQLKVELHSHTSDDPRDRIPYTAEALVRRAHALGFDAIALTNHDLWSAGGSRARAAAEALGVTILAGIEATLDRGAHVIVIGGGPEIEQARTLADLRRAKGAGRLVLAPHPFYPGRTGLGAVLEREIDLFDAIEWSHFWSRRLDRWNAAAANLARRAGKPLVGTSDVHVLDQLGLTYTLVDAAENAPEAILEAIRAGRVELVTRPLSEARMAWILGRIVLRNRLRLGRRGAGEARPLAEPSAAPAEAAAARLDA
jgi:predicted metal-dependent phosphoesterase TrpH